MWIAAIFFFIGFFLLLQIKQGGTDYEYNEFECRFISV